MAKCIIRGCNSTNIKGRSTYTTLISIPKNDRKLWEATCQMPFPKDARVCTLHFSESDFIKVPSTSFIDREQGTAPTLHQSRKLKPGTLPSCLKGIEAIAKLVNSFKQYFETFHIDKENISPVLPYRVRRKTGFLTAGGTLIHFSQ